VVGVAHQAFSHRGVTRRRATAAVATPGARVEWTLRRRGLLCLPQRHLLQAVMMEQYPTAAVQRLPLASRIQQLPAGRHGGVRAMRTERLCPATWYVGCVASAWWEPCSFLLGSATF